MNDRFREALRRIDEANAGDTRREVVNGVERPKELVYAERMSVALTRFRPGASEALRLAARAQHIERWILPRESFPMNRAGYYQWRSKLAQHHADRATSLLSEVGYDAAMQERVASLILKRNRATDPEAQALEDLVCLVFIEYYLEEFATKHAHEPEKVVSILRKTWSKMSADGRRAATQLTVSEPVRKWLARATS